MILFLSITKIILCSGLLYAYYHFFLRNRRFHTYNRFYLLGALLISLLLPFLYIPANFLWQGRAPSVALRTLKVINVGGWEEPVTIYAGAKGWQQWFSAGNLFIAIYAAGLLFGLLALLHALYRIHLLKKQYPYERAGKIKLYHTTAPGTPFSFFSSIFWDDRIALAEEKGQQIFRHELFHVKEKHSLDVLLFEIACCCCWFNPFFHLMKKEVKAIHEFLADQYAADEDQRFAYAELLLMQAIQQKKLRLTTPFFHNQLKRRINMLTNIALIRRGGYISRLMALPFLFLLLSAFAVKLNHTFNGHLSSAKRLTVVIDAGHGGIFPGAHGDDNTLEKDITLRIAQKIQQQAADYNVNIVLTRNTDALVAGATDLKEDLDNRLAIASSHKADLFISIHVNAGFGNHRSSSGFDAVISAKQPQDASRQLASTLLNSLRSVYKANETILARETVRLLDKSLCPAVILECGYITNAADLQYIRENANQDKVALKILEGIVQYAQSQPAASNASMVTEQANPASTSAIAKPLPAQEPADSTARRKVEEEADYPGGNAGWVKYLIKSVHYPPAALKQNLQGSVVVEFIIDRQGKVSDVHAISGPEDLKAESIRVVKESGVWIPAKDHGRAVTSYKRQPITYKIS
ncbi:MAG TPA: N-acetylmuramoyl-L-alanine amidase [Chitinophagaceae bacterium]|nr:N-acetylmuramoyl-L-alanine amidase [Chitinophagaceae bacterium]